MPEDSLQVQVLSVTYPNGVKAIHDINLSLESKGICGIIGPNGGGKTTLIKAVLGLIPHQGKVFWNLKPIKKSRHKIAYVGQKQEVNMDFPIDVYQCVLMGTYPNLGFFKKPGKREKQRSLEAIERVGLTEFKNRQIGELSGGQFQRVLIARMLAQEAELIFLDEPFVGVDVKSEEIIIGLLRDLAQQEKRIFIVHHDLSKVRRYFDQLILINKTLIDYGKTEEVYTKENLRKTFAVLDNPLFN